ncbi:MAG: CtsR family transcriptional regulator [Pyramidobacter sp.]|nr:CtsR family transcriptional regulator [Pyramidobacter sp.]MBP3751219.1 CtsR family transcriptional regulator [Pyramidobacter sp.]MBQ8091346.1 CtsR family transcriptional regulator [Pyramidobacter sp.]MBR0108434.1 CtsR family transcriptional regulator [Pyramidobacter sp.]
MSSLTEVIESYINELFQQEEQDGSADADRVSLRRKDVAERFGCVPSQINYVLRSRFTPERGYIVESQRGGNGYIRILKISYDMPEERAQHIDRIVGDSITEADARRLLCSLQARGMINARERLLIEISLRHISELSDTTFDVSPYKKSTIQADLLKRMLCGLDLA